MKFVILALALSLAGCSSPSQPSSCPPRTSSFCPSAGVFSNGGYVYPDADPFNLHPQSSIGSSSGH